MFGLWPIRVNGTDVAFWRTNSLPTFGGGVQEPDIDLVVVVPVLVVVEKSAAVLPLDCVFANVVFRVLSSILTDDI